MTPEERRREQIRERRRRRRRRRQIQRIIVLCGMAVFAVMIGSLGFFLIKSVVKDAGSSKSSGSKVAVEESETPSASSETAAAPSAPVVDTRQEAIDEASYTAKGYDYEGAIKILQSISGYESDEEITGLIADYQAANDAMVPVNMDTVTHIFYHSLVVDTDRAFNGENSTGFKQWMTTTYEFDQITQQMYDRGYVMVSINDLITRSYDSEGVVHLTKNELKLPEGKTPFVLSLDDLSYYHSYDGYGTAAKLVKDENGESTCIYYDANGNELRGDYDCVPRMNTFLEEHPDGAYHGARGTIALTGYDGILGYRTDIAYSTHENLGTDQQAFLDRTPNFNWDQERSEAQVMADEIKAEGWTFASHTWGHKNIAEASLERIVTDTEKWKSYVETLVGSTDMIIFAHGADMAGVEDYDYNTNAKYAYMKDQGYNVFCNVDSSQYFIQYRDSYFRMGRRNLDGYRLWNDVYGSHNMTSDIIDAASVLDPARTDMPDL